MKKTNRPRAYLKKCGEVIAYMNKKEVPYNFISYIKLFTESKGFILNNKIKVAIFSSNGKQVKFSIVNGIITDGD